MSRSTTRIACLGLACLAIALIASADGPTAATSITSLNGQWMLATDPQNVGREQKWFEKEPVEGAKPARVPWIIQESFPGYHGVAWYWREFKAPVNPHRAGRYLLRFWQVDYLADVWLNGIKVGGHEGGETPFVLDVTSAVKPGQTNRLVVRVLNPTSEPIDGIRLSETAKRCKEGGAKYSAGGSYNHGGITQDVELLCVPAVYLDDLFATATPAATAGRIHVRLGVRNTTAAAQKATIAVTVAPARSGETVASVLLDREIPAGASTIDADVKIDQPHLWDLNDPHLYRVTARLSAEAARSIDERSARCGFREFCFRDGYFRLNGRRIYLRSTHTCNHFPIGLQFAHDPDLLRRDLLNLKVMGFNMVRFIWGAATPVQLDLCDEIGLMVYEESYAAWPIADSPKMAERFDAAVGELIRRDRNHPSVVTWGLLNETNDGPTFRHAAAMLPLVRSLDRDRMVLLNSGRWDQRPHRSGLWKVPGLALWPVVPPFTEPWVAKNTTSETVRESAITWPAGRLALHPGRRNEFSVVRWTASAAGEVQVSATFTGFAHRATTDVHVLHQGRPLFDSAINLDGKPNEVSFDRSIAVAEDDTLDFVVGTGNGNCGGDTTGFAATIRTPQKTYDAVAEFSTQANPNGVWSYGQLPAASSPDAAKFVAFPTEMPQLANVGTLANPGSDVWNDLVSDCHNYPRVPCTAATIEWLRTRTGEKGQPLFLSEYGIGSAVDLWRATRHFEELGAEGLEDAQYLRDKLDRFEADWKNWHLDEIYARPEDFFMESLRKMAGQRTLCLNAIRSNPNIVAHSLTGAIDHVMCGEGLTTLFRELKPGTIDALFDGWYPLRWCLFAEPVHIARGAKIRLEAVLANEDALQPGDYPARLQVIGPNLTRILDRRITVTIPARTPGNEPPLAQPCFSEEVAIDGPTGKYQFLATFERGAAAAGGNTEFYLTDPAEIPGVDGEIVLWGNDPPLAKWLADHGIRTRPFSSPSGKQESKASRCEVILASSKPPAPGGKAVFDELSKRIAAGATAVFLVPQVFAGPDSPTAFLPLEHKGTVATIRSWLYLKDEWAKRHPIFDGMPAGGLMDTNYYRELIPDLTWQGQDPPAEAVAGAIKASQDYSSGLMVAVYPLGKGRLVLNTLKIRENLETHPAAQRLLRNMLRYAATP